MMAGSLVVTAYTEPPAARDVGPAGRPERRRRHRLGLRRAAPVLILAVVFFSWARSEERRGRRLDRTADRTGDAELNACNARLRAMAQSGN